MKVTISKYGSKYWAVWVEEQLLVVTLYKRGALSVVNLVAKLAKRPRRYARSFVPGDASLRKFPPNG
jgi:hypothetical protein